MNEDLNRSTISARAELHRVTRTLKRYLQWQQANAAVGSMPAPATERAAFEATKKAREQIKLDRLKAELRAPEENAAAAPTRAFRSPSSAARNSAAPNSAAPNNAGEVAPAATSPSVGSRFATKSPAPSPAAPDIQGTSKAAPWKTGGIQGSRPVRRYVSRPAVDEAPPVPMPSTERPTPAKAQQSAPQSAPVMDEEAIYLMDFEEMEIPPDYHPGEMLYDAPPTAAPSAQTSRAPAKDPATMSKAEKLDFLRNYMGDCRRCGLCEGRNHVVFGAGNPDARLVFVADAPGAADDLAGTLFSQTSRPDTPDFLLARMVAAMGLGVEDVYLCTVVKCRPPGDRRPLGDEVRECQPFLFKQLEVIQPQVIVALGGFATKVMSAQDPSLKPARGQWQSWRKTPLMPTYHPRELLARQGREQAEMKGATWTDLQAVMVKLGLKA